MLLQLWDSFGRPVYSTKALFQQHPILEVAWSPDGAVFAAGSYDTIRLCNNAGVSTRTTDLGMQLEICTS